jgi:hypothetical protein
MLYAFLSSPVRGLEDVRAAIHDLKLPEGRTIWVDEVDRPRSRTEPSLVTMDDLFRLIREASVLLVLLGSERHGSGLRIDDQTAHVSYWEAELFYAVLLGKTVQVFEVDGFQPDAKLAALLEMFRHALPRTAWSGPHPRSHIEGLIHDFLLSQLSLLAPKLRVGRRLLRTLVDGFFRLRGTDGRGGTAEKESLHFLDGSFADATVVPNEAVISKVLNEVRALPDEQARLTRLWIVFRELSGAPIGSRKDIEFLPYWNRFFGEWASAGSWYGLHGHPHLAVLPALVEQAKVRDRMRALRSSTWREEDTNYPGGALASSRYSIAGLSGSLRNRRFLLHAALADLNRSLNEGITDGGNLLAIRGSVYRRLGAVWAAVADYEEVLRRRQKAGGSDSAIGEAMSELGYGYLFQLRLWRGRSLLEEGVRLLSGSNPRSGFLIRARRKLAAAYALTGHPQRARQELQVARDLARIHGVFDQIR